MACALNYFGEVEEEIQGVQLAEELFLEACANIVPNIDVNTNGCTGCEIGLENQLGHECLDHYERYLMMSRRVDRAVAFLQPMAAEVLREMGRLYWDPKHPQYKRLLLREFLFFFTNTDNVFPLIRVAYDHVWKNKIVDFLREKKEAEKSDQPREEADWGL